MNILLLGNGFDLSHGLPTHYNDFFNIMLDFRGFFDLFDAQKSVSAKGDDGHMKWNGKVYDIDDMDFYQIAELDKLLSDNSWAYYFKNGGANVKGWIDFEREIIPVVDFLLEIFKSDICIYRDGSTFAECIINQEMNSRHRRIASLLKKYFIASNNIKIKREYFAPDYGMLKEVILDSLQEEFNNFIKALEIYFSEFVLKQSRPNLLKQIADINADMIISFNYTETERIYPHFSMIDRKYHIHGVIGHKPNNIVLGINKCNDPHNDCLGYTKYFQRIQKNSSIEFKKIIRESYGKERNVLYIYGHSLDETDRDIIEFLFCNSVEVRIYFYNQKDYEQKVINIIKLFGKEDIEENLEKGRYQFIKISSETI